MIFYYSKILFKTSVFVNFKKIQKMSKVVFFKIPKPEEEALVYLEDREAILYDQLHRHEEIQISYIVEGSGSLMVGEKANKYNAKDILVIGENVPHVFKSETSNTGKSIMYTLFFTKNSFGRDFFRLSDLSSANAFFEEALYGMKILSNKQQIIKLFETIKDQNKIGRISSFLNILNIIIYSEKQTLSTSVYRKKFSEDDGKRMRAVFEHALEHYNEKISLEIMAEKANLSKNAFCRYFKKHTNKSFFQFLIEIRIENAGKLLQIGKELSIASISDQCGFRNIANFNRKFKELKGVTPTQFRSQFMFI